MSAIEDEAAQAINAMDAAIDALGENPRVNFGGEATTISEGVDCWHIVGDGFFLMVRSDVKVLTGGHIRIGGEAFLSPSSNE